MIPTALVLTAVVIFALLIAAITLRAWKTYPCAHCRKRIFRAQVFACTVENHHVTSVLCSDCEQITR